MFMMCKEVIETSKGILSCQKEEAHEGWHSHSSIIAEVEWSRNPFQWKEEKTK